MSASLFGYTSWKGSGKQLPVGAKTMGGSETTDTDHKLWMFPDDFLYGDVALLLPLM